MAGTSPFASTSSDEFGIKTLELPEVVVIFQDNSDTYNVNFILSFKFQIKTPQAFPICPPLVVCLDRLRHEAIDNNFEVNLVTLMGEWRETYQIEDVVVHLNRVTKEARLITEAESSESALGHVNKPLDLYKLFNQKAYTKKNLKKEVFWNCIIRRFKRKIFKRLQFKDTSDYKLRAFNEERLNLEIDRNFDKLNQQLRHWRDHVDLIRTTNTRLRSRSKSSSITIAPNRQLNAKEIDMLFVSNEIKKIFKVFAEGLLDKRKEDICSALNLSVFPVNGHDILREILMSRVEGAD
jgi:ubiquitin-protein ligase